MARSELKAVGVMYSRERQICNTSWGYFTFCPLLQIMFVNCLDPLLFSFPPVHMPIFIAWHVLWKASWRVPMVIVAKWHNVGMETLPPFWSEIGTCVPSSMNVQYSNSKYFLGRFINNFNQVDGFKNIMTIHFTVSLVLTCSHGNLSVVLMAGQYLHSLDVVIMTSGELNGGKGR